jgi:putative integral membrane protein (TIGR02587 family)
MTLRSARGAEKAPGGEDDSPGLLPGLGRAFGGALIFGLPLLMTMELWEFGFAMHRGRLALLMTLAVPLLVAVSHRIGFEPSFDWREDLRDAFLAYGIGIAASGTVLSTFGVLEVGMPADELLGKVAVQSVPAALGALLARSQFGGNHAERDNPEALSGYFGTLFLMLVGALFLGLNVAPTEEIVLIAFLMTPWHSVALVALSIALMHGFVFALDFRGSPRRSGVSWWSSFFRFTLVGYVLAVGVSLYVLWTFGRTDGAGFVAVLMSAIVLAFPASIGAAAARLIL